MTDTSLTIPPDITFEQAIALTQTLLAQLEAGNLSDATLEETLAALVQTENGARGFFVTYSTDDRPFADQPSPAIVRALQTAPAVVAELLVKNLAMSTAMAITHRRNQNEAMAQGSDRVRSRTAHLIQLVQLPEVIEKATQLRDSTATGSGSYAAFLDRWKYDSEQRQAMQQALDQVIDQAIS